ncbi:MAG: hypothetical protein ABL879_08280 [Devosia sp.]
MKRATEPLSVAFKRAFEIVEAGIAAIVAEIATQPPARRPRRGTGQTA